MSDPKNRGDVHQTRRKGPISQDNLLRIMKPIVDTAMGKVSSRSRDEARAAVRTLMAEANWNTPFILRNIGARRARYLSSLGYVIDSRWLGPQIGDVERISAYEEGRRRG